MLTNGPRYSLASAQRRVKGVKDYIPTGPNLGLSNKMEPSEEKEWPGKKATIESSVRTISPRASLNDK